MVDILLLYPRAGQDIRGVSVNAPLALLTLAGALKPHFSVRIIDQRVTDDFWNEVHIALQDNPLFVGVTSMTGTQIHYALEISRFVKTHSDIPVVWGGMHPTTLPEQTVANPYIDFVIKGEGEESLLSLAAVLSSKNPDYKKVPGLYWKEAGRVVSTPLADPIEINRIPKLPWAMVNVEEYTSPTQFLYKGVTRLLPYEGSRGCPFKCTYCSQPVLTRKYRVKRPETVVEECLEMVEKYKLDHIVFFDDEFFVDHKWATQVAELIDGKFTWWAQTRAEDLLRVNLNRLESCGLLVLAPGLESGSNRILKQIRKGETVEKYREVNLKLAQTNIITQYNFIIGFPNETQVERNQTIDLVLELLAANKNCVVNQVSPLTPLPGTQLIDEVEKHFNFQKPAQLEDWIQVTRGRQDRSWLDHSAVRVIRFIYYSSYFLCTVERYSQKLGIPKWLLTLYSASIKLRWKKKWYRLDWEIPLIRLLFRYYLNPIDFKIPKHKTKPLKKYRNFRAFFPLNWRGQYQ